MGKLDGVNVFENLFEVGLNSCGLFGLGQNLEKVIIGEEVKTGKLLSLLLKILIEAFLDLF